MNRRGFLRACGAVAAGAALSPLIRVKRAFGGSAFKAKRVVICSIAGGLRLRESLGMGDGATLPNLLGDVPLVSGYGASPAGAPMIAPEYMAPDIVVPAPRAVPIYTQGALVTNLRYAAGQPGHLQGAACLATGVYNNIDNRADAHPPAPTLFEIHRRAANASAMDAWYVSAVAGFYRALQASAHQDFGPRYGGSWVSPPSSMNAVIPIVSSDSRKLVIDGLDTKLPVVSDPSDEAAAVRRMKAVLDGGMRPYDDDGTFRASDDDNAALEQYLASIYGDPTYESFYAQSFGIGVRGDDGRLKPTSDVATTFHAERILAKFKPSVLLMSLIDIDACHSDYNGYLLNQTVADACVAHLWDMIQSTDGLRDETALLVLPEHGRQLAYNGKNPDSLGRSGLDHGGGDDGDRDVWLLALGPDFKPGVAAPTGIQQDGRASGRYETIDAVMTAAALLGHADLMAKTQTDLGERPGLVMEGILR